MEVKLSELRTICNTILDHFESTGRTHIELDQDLYWWIPAAERYNPYTAPTGLTLGQLSDDWNELQKCALDKDLIVNYYLVWLSTVLAAIGETPDG